MKLHKTIIRDALELLSTGPNGADANYARGIFVGLTAGIMAATGTPCDDVLAELKQHLPTSFQTEAIPPSWLEEMFPDDDEDSIKTMAENSAELATYLLEDHDE